MKCECGKILSELEKDTNEYIAKKTKSKRLDLCQVCWDEYCNHAITGE